MCWYSRLGLAEKPAVTPLGRPEAAKVTLPVKPFSGLTVIVLVALLPCVTDRLFGDGERVKFGAPLQALKANDPMFVCQSNVPVTD